jgi:hypothetical protein
LISGGIALLQVAPAGELERSVDRHRIRTRVYA